MKPIDEIVLYDYSKKDKPIKWCDYCKEFTCYIWELSYRTYECRLLKESDRIRRLSMVETNKPCTDVDWVHCPYNKVVEEIGSS